MVVGMFRNGITQEKLISAMIIIISLLVMGGIAYYSIRNDNDSGNDPASGIMPDIVGYSFSEIGEFYAGEFELSAVGEEYSDKFAEGAILSQSIPAGEKYERGAIVEVTVSLGAEKTAVTVTEPPEEEMIPETVLSEEIADVTDISEIEEETAVSGDNRDIADDVTGNPPAEFENYNPEDELEFAAIGFYIDEQGSGRDSEIYNELYDLLRRKGVDAGYLYYEPDTGRSLEYNADERFSAGSIIKAIYARTVLDGSADLDAEYEMTEEMLNSPYELINGQPVGTMFSVRELIEAALVKSDNTAYKMLYNYIGYDNFNHYAAGLGLQQRMTDDNYWFRLTARETAVYFKEIYNFCAQSPNGPLMMECMSDAVYREMFASALPGKTVAEKYGYLPQEDFYTLGDAAIISGDDDYILVMYWRNTGEVNTEPFKQAAALTDELHGLIRNAEQPEY